jgi:hypothetical protein
MRPSADGPAPWRRIELDIFEARLVQQLANGRPAARQAAIGVVTQEHIGRLASIGDDDRPMSAARLARPIFWLNSRLENVVIVMTPRAGTIDIEPTMLHRDLWGHQSQQNG